MCAKQRHWRCRQEAASIKHPNEAKLTNLQPLPLPPQRLYGPTATHNRTLPDSSIHPAVGSRELCGNAQLNALLVRRNSTASFSLYQNMTIVAQTVLLADVSRRAGWRQNTTRHIILFLANATNKWIHERSTRDDSSSSPARARWILMML